MKILFVCNQGENRSKTARDLFNNKFETKSAGIYAQNKANEISKEILEWADVIMVMKKHHRTWICDNYPTQYLKKRILCLNISDIYKYNQYDLIKILKEKINKLMKEIDCFNIK